MKRTEAVDAALKMVGGGRIAYICHDGGDLRVDERIVGKMILTVRPSKPVTRETLVVLLAHRMRMKGVR